MSLHIIILGALLHLGLSSRVAGQHPSLAILDEPSVAQQGQPCEMASDGHSFKCYVAVDWAMKVGIHKHPEWYPGLWPNSTWYNFQQLLHQTGYANCPVPCQLEAVMGADAKQKFRFPAGFGRWRKVLIHTPRNLPHMSPGTALPLVFNLHAWGAKMGHQVEVSKMNELADREGFVVVYPEGGYKAVPYPGWTGVGYSWNAGACCPKANWKHKNSDDVGFLHEVVNVTRKHLSNISNNLVDIDIRRIYGTGMSNGAFMINRVACEAPEFFAAIAPVAGMLANGSSPKWKNEPYLCKQPSRPVPTLHFHNSGDRIVKVKGTKKLGFPSLDDYIRLRRLLNGHNVADDNGTITKKLSTVTCTSFGSALQNVTVCITAKGTSGGFGHSWPGFVDKEQLMLDYHKHGWKSLAALARSYKGMDATAEMWEFFKGHSLDHVWH